LTKLTYNEEEMGNAFQLRLKSRRPLQGLGRFSRVFREVDCQRGRPDFVGISFMRRQRITDGRSVAGFATATVLSLLKPESPRRVEYLVKHSGFSQDAVTSALRNLLARGFIERRAKGYCLASARQLFDVDIAAFELKLSSPRRAVFQAQQYSLFANRVVIVVPPNKIQGFTPYLPSLKRWGIGLATFDPHTRRFQLSVPAKWSNPVSRQHQAYALLRLAGGCI
jgi:hypothetical protein